MSEVWKAVVGYEGVYEVSNLGRVKRILPASHTRAGRIVKATTYGNGKKYLRVSLSRNNKRISVQIHKLVALAFLGPRPDGMTINHIDTDPTNNRDTNLEYVTFLGNYWHARKNGTMPLSFTDAQVSEIRKLSATMPVEDIAEKFGAREHSIWRIVTGRTRVIQEPKDYHDA
jgi:hypothetical protein